MSDHSEKAGLQALLQRAEPLMLSDSGQVETLLLNPLAGARAAQDQPDEALALVLLRRTRHRFGGHTQAAR